MAKPPGVRITLTPTWLAVTRALAQDLDAHLILGVNLETDSLPLAAAEAHAFLARIGRRYIEALEPGNEPELYRAFTYYLAPDGSNVDGRPRDYNIVAISRDFTRIESVLPTPIAGPAIGAPKWFAQLGTFLADGPRINLITLHRYPLQRCFTSPAESTYPTIAHLLDNQSSFGRADSVIPEVALAHARGLMLRVDEMNTISCGSDPQVGFSFATALWAVNALFAMADVGVDGVNIHSYPTSSYAPFSFTRANGTWKANVEPEYYGLLMFAQAAPPGSRILRVSGPGATALRAWATLGPDRRTRVVLINDSATRSVTIAVRTSKSAAATWTATIERLQAPSLSTNHGVTLGGASFGPSTATGKLQPRSTTIHRTQDAYLVTVHPASAALLTIP
jgi:glycosyl hydrolase family 79